VGQPVLPDAPSHTPFVTVPGVPAPELEPAPLELELWPPELELVDEVPHWVAQFCCWQLMAACDAVVHADDAVQVVRHVVSVQLQAAMQLIYDPHSPAQTFPDCQLDP